MLNFGVFEGKAKLKKELGGSARLLFAFSII